MKTINAFLKNFLVNDERLRASKTRISNLKSLNKHLKCQLLKKIVKSSKSLLIAGSFN